jgi:DNA-binding MarR family transcriptional regulator
MTNKKPLDETEWDLWHALKTLSEAGLAAVGSVLETATGLSGSDFGILSRLEDLGDGALSQQRLQASLGWDKSRLSHHLTRMEGRGLLRRVRPASGRGVSLKITQKGRNAVAAARPVHASAVREQVLRHIRPPEAAVLLELVRRMRIPPTNGA